MNVADFRYGFRILGGCYQPRRLVDAGAAFAGYAACDERAECGRESYLSAFLFAAEFADHLKATGSTKGYAGPCWSAWLWWDLDSDELAHAHADARALAAFLVARYNVEPGEPLLFFSGSKGFHIGLPTSLWLPAPSSAFAKTARRFAEHVAELAAVTIDSGVYDKVRAFRAPNGRHPKTGLHKRRLTFDELLGPLAAIVELAAKPAPFDVPQVTRTSEAAAADWQAATALVASEGEAKAARRATSNGSLTLNRSRMLNKATMLFIREGAGTGDRHRLLCSAAANLAEFGCTPALAAALLEESALDSGLPPKDVRRAIDWGLSAVPSPLPIVPMHQDAPQSTQGTPDGSTVTQPPEAAANDSGGFDWQTGQQVTGIPDAAPPADLQSALAKLWGSTPAPPPTDTAAAAPADTTPAPSEAPQHAKGPPVLTPLPPPLVPLPPGAVGTGILETPCRCGSTEYVDVAIGEGRTRRDCRKCGRFVGFGKWYDQGGIA